MGQTVHESVILLPVPTKNPLGQLVEKGRHSDFGGRESVTGTKYVPAAQVIVSSHNTPGFAPAPARHCPLKTPFVHTVLSHSFLPPTPCDLLPWSSKVKSSPVPADSKFVFTIVTDGVPEAVFFVKICCPSVLPSTSFSSNDDSRMSTTAVSFTANPPPPSQAPAHFTRFFLIAPRVRTTVPFATKTPPPTTLASFPSMTVSVRDRSPSE